MAPPSSTQNGRSSTDTTRSDTRPSTDPRFANLNTDPRYRPTSRRQNHVKIDKRFAHMLRDDDFSAKSSVDRYGRRLPKGSGKKKLESMYEVENSEDEDVDQVDDDDEVRKELARIGVKHDPAREGGFSESSSSESEDEQSSSSSEDEDDAAVEAGLEEDREANEDAEEVPMGEISSRIAAVNLDWDNIRAVDLMAVAHSFCPPEGRILDVSIYPSEFGRERMEREELEGPPKELFVPTKSSARKAESSAERSRSPPVSEHDPSSDADAEPEEDDDNEIQKSILAHASAPEPEIDSRALRAYQLSRLRYFYAVITCSSNSTAHALYTSMDGREYLSTANFFDLRFVPNEVTFEEKPRDVSKNLPDGYRPQEFVTEALTHSKVRLTWDEEDQGRKEAQKRAFGTQEKGGKFKSRSAEIDENDLRAYVGSDSDSSEGDGGVQKDGNTLVDGVKETTKDRKTSKSEQARRKMREALGLPVSEDPAPKSKSKSKSKEAKSRTTAPAGNMQVTFSAGLSSTPAETPSSVFQNAPSDVYEETTREKYIRKEKERKARRKAKSKTNPEGEDDDAEPAAAIVKSPPPPNTKVTPAEAKEDDPFNDPFFMDPASANAAARKEAKRAKRDAAAAEAAAMAERKARERAQLELLMDDGETGTGARGSGFDMAAIRKAEKEAAKKGRKGRKGRGKDKENLEQKTDAFEMDVEDPRFKGVFENHEFAIDPSNPRFSGTKEMKRLLEEGRKKRSRKDDDDGVNDAAGNHVAASANEKGGSGEVDELLKKIKRRKAA